MKKILLLAIFSLSVALINAQETSLKPQVDFYANEFTAGVGFLSLSDLVGGLAMGLNSLGNDETYQMSDDTSYFPTLTLGYARQLTPLINVSMIMGYSQMREDILYTSDLSKAGYSLIGCLSFMPYVRFDWVRAKWVKCYSKLGVGLSLYLSSKVYNNAPDLNSSTTKATFAFDVVPFGIIVGRSFYGFGEVGLGTIGIFKGGVGYRF